MIHLTDLQFFAVVAALTLLGLRLLAAWSAQLARRDGGKRAIAGPIPRARLDVPPGWPVNGDYRPRTSAAHMDRQSHHHAGGTR